MKVRGLLAALLAAQINSFVGRLSSTFQGSTETTFYVLAVYFGSVGIKNTRYAVLAGLFADFIGIIAAIVIAYIFCQNSSKLMKMTKTLMSIFSRRP